MAIRKKSKRKKAPAPVQDITQSDVSKAEEDIQRSYASLVEAAVNNPEQAEKLTIEHYVFSFDRWALLALDACILQGKPMANLAAVIKREKDENITSLPRVTEPLVGNTAVPVLLKKVDLLLEGRIVHWYAEYNRRTREKGNESGTVAKSADILFPKRAEWLKTRLKERGWSASSPSQHEGPDKNTVHRILRGEKVTEHSLWKLTIALSFEWPTPVYTSDIPRC